MTWSALADALSIRNCTCMSTQPSLRLRPATFGTSRILVRYIFPGFAAAPARVVFLFVFRLGPLPLVEPPWGVFSRFRCLLFFFLHLFLRPWESKDTSNFLI